MKSVKINYKKKGFLIMSEINSKKVSLQENMLPDLIQKVEYLNISCKAKAPARFNIRLSNVIDNPIYYVSKAGNSVSLEGYQSPSTGLFITNDTLNDKVVDETAKAACKNTVYKGETSAIGCLYRELFFDMHKRISKYVSQLRKKQEKDPKAYDSVYKDPDVIAAELIDYLSNTAKFMTNVYSELRMLPLHDVPVLNSKLSYIDDDHTDVGVTDLVPFANPKRQSLTDEQKELVERFLSVFFDEDNLSVFSWMMGAVFMNEPIHAENISRFFLLYSSEGGVGKSTVMKLITEGLLPSSFAILLPEFDTYFLSGDRFRSSNLSQKRLVVYDEAVFNGPTDRENNHDFHGINEDVIKTFATNGRLLLEKKFQAPKLAQFDNIHVILTNFLPVVPLARKDLGRRFLPCMLKPTTMQEKARELNGMTVAQMIDYVRKNGQAFINYFAKAYSDDPYKYTNYVYHHDDTESEERTNIENNARAVDEYHEKLKSLGAFEMLKKLGSDLDADSSSLIADCKKAIPSDEYIQNSKRKFVTYTNPDNKDIHVGMNTQTNEMFIYINRSKRLFAQYHNGLAIREELFAIADQKKKFTQDVFELPLNNAINDVESKTTNQAVDFDLASSSKQVNANNLSARITQSTNNVKTSGNLNEPANDIERQSAYKQDMNTSSTNADIQNKGIIEQFAIIDKRSRVNMSQILHDIQRYSPTMRIINAVSVYVNTQNDTFIYAKNGSTINIYIDIEKLQKRYGDDVYRELLQFSNKTLFDNVECFKYYI